MGETIAGMEPGSSRTSSRTRVRAGQLLPGVDGRSVWLRRCKAILAGECDEWQESSLYMVGTIDEGREKEQTSHAATHPAPQHQKQAAAVQ